MTRSQEQLMPLSHLCPPTGSPSDALRVVGPQRDKKNLDWAVAALSKSELKFHPAE